MPILMTRKKERNLKKSLSLREVLVKAFFMLLFDEDKGLPDRDGSLCGALL